MDLVVVDPASPTGIGGGRRPDPVGPLLRSIHSALKPDGYVYLMIDRRVRPSGRRGIGFAALRSLRRYRRLLAQADYHGIRVWAAYPDGRDPKFFVECRQPVFAYFVHVFRQSRPAALRGAALRLLNFTGLLQYGAPAYGVLARRGSRAP
jgi:SAM-dependent methyltransferase